MPKRPHIQTLPKQTANILIQQIQQGKFLDNLPGENTLCQNLQISRSTLRKALEILTKDGVLEPPKTGQRRKILQQNLSSTNTSQSISILLPRPLDEMHPSCQDLFRLYRKKMEISGIECVFHHLPYHGSRSISRQLNEFATTHKANIWIIFEPTREIAKWFEENPTPCIFCGGQTSQISTSIHYDGAATLRHALCTLIRKKHHRIVNFCPYDTDNVKTITRKTLEEYNYLFEPEFHVFKCYDTKDDLISSLQSCFKHPDPPTAIITNSPLHILTVLTWLGSQGLRVPTDISMLHIGSDPMLKPLVPEISHYSTPFQPIANAMAKASSELLNTGKASNKKLIMDYIPGQSLNVALPKKD